MKRNFFGYFCVAVLLLNSYIFSILPFSAPLAMRDSDFEFADFRFEDLKVQINPQSGTNGTIIVIDIVAVIADVAGVADLRSVLTIVAGRP